MRLPRRAFPAAIAILSLLMQLQLPTLSLAGPTGTPSLPKEEPVGALDWVGDHLLQWGAPALLAGTAGALIGLKWRSHIGQPSTPPTPPPPSSPSETVQQPPLPDTQRQFLPRRARIRRPSATASSSARVVPPWRFSTHFLQFRAEIEKHKPEDWRKPLAGQPVFLTGSIDGEIASFVQGEAAARVVNKKGWDWFRSWTQICVEQSWGLIHERAATYEELFAACQEAYRRALHADPTRYPDPLRAPLPVQRAADGNVVPVNFPPDAPSPPTSTWAEAAAADRPVGGEERRYRSEHDQDQDQQPLAFVRQMPQLLARLRAPAERAAPAAWHHLVKDAGRGVGPGSNFALKGARLMWSVWGVPRRL